MRTLLIDAKRSSVLVIDMQEKILPAIRDRETLVAGTSWLVRVAQEIGVPVAAVEQYPKGLGPTIESLRQLFPPAAIASKAHFSGVASGGLAALPGADRAQIIIAGIEAHVCVLQTALDLVQEGKEVYVVADCVGSRRPSDLEFALRRLRQEGARIVSREMAAFEWLREADTPLFRAISRKYLRVPLAEPPPASPVVFRDGMP